MAGAGVRGAFVYGLYPVSVPLIAVGLAWAVITAARADWGNCATGLAVAATCQGRAALDRYTAMLRRLPQVARQDQQAPAPGACAGDADRDAAAAAWASTSRKAG